MSRTGPGYVETTDEMFSDLEQKQNQGEISAEIAQTFGDLYEFAQGLGDSVDIGGAKNANFKLKVKEHRGESRTGNPSIFTVNVAGKVKIWPAKMPIDYGYIDVVSWTEQDYRRFERAFQALNGVPRGANEAPFTILTSGENLEDFKDSVREFAAACRSGEQK